VANVSAFLLARERTYQASVSNLFFLPPSLLKSLESRPIEEVLFLRRDGESGLGG